MEIRSKNAATRKMLAVTVSGGLFRLLVETISGDELEKLLKNAIVKRCRFFYAQIKDVRLASSNIFTGMRCNCCGIVEQTVFVSQGKEVGMHHYRLSNGFIERIIEVSERGVRSISLKDSKNGVEYIHLPVREFAFSIDDVYFTSYQESRIREVDGNTENVGTAPRFLNAREDGANLELDFSVGPVLLTVAYRTWPGLCGMRKHLKIRNPMKTPVRLSNLVFDDTCAEPGNFGDCDFYAGCGDMPQSCSFTLEGREDIVRCHNPKLNIGFLIGSSAPGVLRYFLVYPNWRNTICGMNMSSAPFARILEADETFTTPESIIALYRGGKDDPETVRDFRQLVRKGLPPMKSRENIMYCTWIPFLKNINESLTVELAGKAAALGFGTFVLDDGWFNGDGRAVDSAKFPRGLNVLADQVRNSGMRFGLWLNIGTDYGLPGMQEKWFTRRPDGKINRLGFDYSHSCNIFCFGSGYRRWVREQLDLLAEKYQVSYFKLDFSSIASPYGISPWGCHSREHEYHHGWEDSFSAMYEGMFELRDFMLKHHPETTVDFSFESFGTEYPNIAALELSELHHVSNFSANDPETQSIDRVRKNFYSWLGKLPPERILNGLLSIHGDRGAEYLLTSLAGAPLVAGDLRSLTDDLRARLKVFASAFNAAAGRGAMTEFRVLADQPDADGFMRVAADGHGIAGFFNRAHEIQEFDIPDGFRFSDVETGSEKISIPPHDCTMFQVCPI